MNYIVLDMEWNQPFNRKSIVKKPVLLYGEIIQIGAVKLDDGFNITDSFKIMVSPKHYRIMNKKISRLTGITTDDLKGGVPFQAALADFKKWCGDEFIFLTWGLDDINMLRDNMLLHRANTDWLPKVYNVQFIFDHQVTKENRQISLTYAMEKLGEPPFTAHDALNDARSTACICTHLDMAGGLLEYQQLERQIKTAGRFAGERTASLGTYQSKEEALADPRQTHYYCPTCGAYAACGEFVWQAPGKCNAFGKCDEGHEFFVRLKLTKWSDGKYSVAKILNEVTEDNRHYYVNKLHQSSGKDQ